MSSEIAFPQGGRLKAAVTCAALGAQQRLPSKLVWIQCGPNSASNNKTHQDG